MNNTNIPSSDDVPTMGKLIKSTILAICIAAIILVTAVLPAEYGVDPTGIGEIIGLVRMGEIKASLAQETAIEKKTLVEGDSNFHEKQNTEVASVKTVSDKEADYRSDKIAVTLEPNEGKEIKLTMTKGSTVDYKWYTDGGKANFDSHADSKKLEIEYHNYQKGQLEESEGDLEAAFDGNHGWFWRNRTSETMIVTLEVNGNYTDVLQF
jgi:hypothetical protein